MLEASLGERVLMSSELRGDELRGKTVLFSFEG